MRKRLDTLFAALMIVAGIAVILAGMWCLSRSIDRAKERLVPIPIAPLHLEPPEPTPELEPTLAPDNPTYNQAIPLDAELQQALYEACRSANVPIPLALGLIEVESCFQADAVSSEGCYGLMQLNPKYFPDKLSPADNIRAGIAYLGELLERYGDAGAALTAYCVGYDAGGRVYASAVLEAAERWEME